MEFWSITHYFFNESWNSDLWPINFLMITGILIHYPLIFLWVMEFESNTHYFFNEQWNSDPLPNIFLMTNGIRIHYPLLL